MEEATKKTQEDQLEDEIVDVQSLLSEPSFLPLTEPKKTIINQPKTKSRIKATPGIHYRS